MMSKYDIDIARTRYKHDRDKNSKSKILDTIQYNTICDRF